MRARFAFLSGAEKQRIKDDIDHVCFDTLNYDAATDTFCPIAVAMNLHKTTWFPTDATITRLIATRFRPVNVLKGVEGTFYTSNRKEDLLSLL